MIDRKFVIRRLLFAAYFAIAFLIFLLLLFPVEQVKTKLESEVRQRTPFTLNVASVFPGS